MKEEFVLVEAEGIEAIAEKERVLHEEYRPPTLQRRVSFKQLVRKNERNFRHIRTS